MMHPERAGRNAKSSKARRHCAAAVAVFLGASGAALPHAVAQDRANEFASRCIDVVLPVAVTEGSAATNNVAGHLCLPLDDAATTVHLVIHGATYNHSYWNWPYKSALYSYSMALTAAGYAVFDYDRLGSGQSSHPVSTQLSIASDAYVAHQLVQALRKGGVGGVAFDRVVLAGHSLGSYIAWEEAGKYQDVDGVILTGIAHASNTLGKQQALADIYPAISDPRFADWKLDPGYLTTRPSTRAALFYDTATAEPKLIAFDEATKDLTTGTELADMLASGPDAPANFVLAIRVPVLLIDGQDDDLFCTPPGMPNGTDCTSSATLAAAEKPFYNPAANLQAVVIPDTGHDLNLHLSAPLTYSVVRLWSDSFIGWDGSALGRVSRN